MRLLYNYDWEKRANSIKNRCTLKWNARKQNIDPEFPNQQSEKRQDIEYLPGNFISLIRLFGSKCKYCNLFRVSPLHLRETHQINIVEFTPSSVLKAWQTEKKLFISQHKPRQEIVSLSQAFIQRFIDSMKIHCVCKH